jgi:VacB/RNase II family 3'-5' exoribonuclease
MTHPDLSAAAREEMIRRGFNPDIPAAALQQAQQIVPHPNGRDLTSLAWSSIDNDESRDLDQVEWAERVADGIRVLVGIADVSAAVDKDTPIDAYAGHETTTIYAGVRTFPMLPEHLSTNLTSLSEGEARAAVVLEFIVQPDGCLGDHRVYPATIRNRARLTYSAMGPWLEGTGALDAPPDLQQQLRLQDEAAQSLRQARDRMGALTFDRKEAEPVISADGHVTNIVTRASNRAAHLIEDFMIAANEVMARTLRAAGVASIRRVVKAPERWPRIVELAAQYNDTLPPDPDAKALNAFLLRRREADPHHYPDVSLAVLKLMGSGEYVLMRPGDEAQGHFGLAAHDYTHSTAPNRRFSDLVTQRLLRALGGPAPYTDDELDAIARNCTEREDAGRKVERAMTKRIAATALASHIGQDYAAVVTGVTPKGVFVRIVDPPIEGRLMRGEEGLDVGDRLHVRLLSTDPQRGYIDFGRE